MKVKNIQTILILIFSIVLASAQYTTESDDFSYPVKLYDQKFYDLAARQFVKFYNKYPQSPQVPDAKYYAGMSYYREGKFHPARIEFQSLALEYPHSPKAAEGWFRSGQCYESLQSFEEAAKAYQSIRLLYPDHNMAPEGLYYAGKINILKKNYHAALVNLNVILDRYAASAFYFPALTKAGLAHSKLSELQQAKIKLTKVLEGNTAPETKLEAKLVMASIFEQQGYFGQARTYLEQLIAEGPQTGFAIQASLQLSRLFIQEKNYEKARQYLSRQLDDLNDQDIQREFNLLLGDVNYLSGQYALAFDLYDKIKFVDSDSLAVILKLKGALSLKKQNLTNRAIEYLKPIAEENSNINNETKRVIQELYLDWLKETGRNNQALSILYDWVNTSESYPEKASFTLRISKILATSAAHRDIIRELQPFILMQDKIPEKDDILFALADAYGKVGEYEESIYLYRRLIREYSASIHYQSAFARIRNLSDYKLINQDSLAFRTAELMGMSLLTDDKATILFELGKMYYSDLKAYHKAESYFNKALQAGASNSGDIYLFLGKTYIKMAEKKLDADNQPDPVLMSKANDNFKKAVENIGTCTKPDEASWLMIETVIMTDEVPREKLKRLIDHLVEKYPGSALKEKWIETLAYTLAFDEALQAESIKYFQQLIQEFKFSDNHPAHIFGLARLIEGEQSEAALDFYRQIAIDYSSSPQAAQALEAVALHYETKLMYQEANLLYTRLLNNYFYSNVAEDARKKLGEIYVYSADYNKAISLIQGQIISPFINDYLLLREFMDEYLYDNIYYLASAYRGKKETQKAVHFYKMYLNIASSGSYRNMVYFDLGELFFLIHQERIAADYFKSVSKENNEIYTMAQHYLAEIYFVQADYAQAAQVYSSLKILVTDPEKQSEIYGRHIVALLRAGDHKKANVLIKDYKKKFKNEKNYHAQFLIEYGKYYRANKNFDRAIKLFKEVRKKYKSSNYADDADYYLALTYLTLNKTDDAYKLLSEFYTNYPKSDRLPAVYNSLGSLYFRGEKYDDAITMFKNALTICKERDLEKNIMSNLINAYSYTGFWDAALATAKQYVQKFPDADDRISKKIMIGRSYTNLNQFQNAVDYLKQIKLEADSETEPEIQFYIGEALLKAGQYENAIAEFVKIPLLSRKTKLQWEASALYFSGQAYEKLGRASDAVRMYEEIVRRPGIDAALKGEAKKRIKQIQG